MAAYTKEEMNKLLPCLNALWAAFAAQCRQAPVPWWVIVEVAQRFMVGSMVKVLLASPPELREERLEEWMEVLEMRVSAELEDEAQCQELERLFSEGAG